MLGSIFTLIRGRGGDGGGASKQQGYGINNPLVSMVAVVVVVVTVSCPKFTEDRTKD